MQKVRDLAAFKLNVWLPQQKARNLYLLKNDELKVIAESIGVDGADKRSNVSLRQEIYRKIGDLKLKEIFVKLNAEEGKVICEKYMTNSLTLHYSAQTGRVPMKNQKYRIL